MATNKQPISEHEIAIIYEDDEASIEEKHDQFFQLYIFRST